MNDQEKLCLDAVSDLILKDVRADDIQDHLFETSVLNLPELEMLELEKNPKRQTEMLLKWVQEKPGSFPHFCEALRDRHGYITQRIEDLQAQRYDCQSFDSSSTRQQDELRKTCEVVGDGNFVIAESTNTQVHMKSRHPLGPGPR